MDDSRIKSIIEHLPGGYSYLIEKQREGVSVRIKEVKDKESFQEWLKKLMFISKVTWRICRTRSYGHKNVYRGDLRCQNSKNYKKTFGKRKCKSIYECPALLDIQIRNYRPNLNPKYMEPLAAEWPAIALFKNDHNHPLDSAEVLRHRDMSQETRDKLKNLFLIGYKSTSASDYLKTELLLNHGNSYFQIECDSYYIPSLSVIGFTLLKHSEASKTTEELDVSVMIENYRPITSGNAHFWKSEDNKHYFVIICSPIMMRLLQTWYQKTRLIMVDSVKGCKRKKHNLYYFSTPTDAGFLPIALVITNSKDDEPMLKKALQTLKSVLPENSMSGQNEPRTFLLNCDVDTKIIQREFPHSLILFSQSSFLRVIRLWILEPSNGVDSKDGLEIYLMVKDVLHASDKNAAQEKHNTLMASATAQKYPQFCSLYLKMWRSKSRNWTEHFPKNELEGGRNFYVDFMFDMIRNSILEKPMTHKLVLFLHFCLTLHEKYLQKRLLDFKDATYPKYIVDAFLPKQLKDKNLSLKKLDAKGMYCVIDTMKGDVHFVDTISNTCSCSDALMKKRCLHLCAVLVNLENEVNSAFKSVNEVTKKLLLYIGTGEGICPKDWEKNCQSYLESISRASSSATLQPSIPECSTSNSMDSTSEELSPCSSPIAEVIAVDEGDVLCFQEFCNRIKDGLENNPGLFVPAFKNMMENVKMHCTTDAKLVSSMYSFGLS